MNKYINSFKTVEDYNAYVLSDEYATPNVAFIAENNNFESSGGDRVETIIIDNGGDDETVKGIIDNSITKCNIPQGTTSIGNNKFSNCSGLTTVTIPDSVTSIGMHAFNGCTALTGITIPDSVTSIGNSAFANCKRFQTVTIPDSVTSIGSKAFDNCTKLAIIVVKASTPPSLGINAIYYKSLAKIYVPSNSVDTYKSASGWSGYADKIFPIEW